MLETSSFSDLSSANIAASKKVQRFVSQKATLDSPCIHYCVSIKLTLSLLIRIRLFFWYLQHLENKWCSQRATGDLFRWRNPHTLLPAAMFLDLQFKKNQVSGNPSTLFKSYKTKFSDQWTSPLKFNVFSSLKVYIFFKYLH